MKKAVKITLLVVGILAVLGFGGCVASMFLVGSAVNETVKEIDKKDNAEQKALDDMLKNAPKPKVERNEYEYKVTYTFKNTSKINFDYIELQLNVFDKNGTKLDTNFTNITDVKSGQTFSMTVDLYQEGAEKFEVNSFSANPLN
jgi:hypothetical protein